MFHFKYGFILNNKFNISLINWVISQQRCQIKK